MGIGNRGRALALRLFNGFDIRLDGRPIDGVSYNTMRALLAYLAVEPPRDHRREFLAELLWEGQDPTTARGNLRRALSDLRRAIEGPSGKGLFIAGKQSLRFIPDLSIDVFNFTRPLAACDRQSEQQCRACLAEMEQTAGLYRGEFLRGFALPGCYAFDEWLLHQREALHRHALALFERLATCHERLGHHAGALPFALRYVELEPTDESGHRRVMRLYALDNQSGVALHQYSKCVQLLKSELAALPEEETQRLARQIRRGDVGAAARPRTKGQARLAVSAAPAERRQVTVLYCELTLREAFDSDDPEEALERLRSPQARCLDIVRRHGGHTVQAHGGGLLVYFGYPQANENAARHGVNAALAMVQDAGAVIEARIGVHTGMIVTGLDPSIPDSVGQTSRLAIQFRQTLPPGQSGVAISDATHAIAGRYFECAELRDMPTPGAAKARCVYRVMRANSARSRLDAATRLTPMVGRDAELARLHGLWRQAKAGQGHVLLLQGEPGIGKSRLIHSFRQAAAGDGAVFELRCFAESCHSSFHPVIGLIETVFGFKRTDTPGRKFHKLAAHLTATPLSRDAAAVSLLGKLLGLPLPTGYQALAMTADEVKQHTFSLLAELMLSMVAGKCAVLIWEDLHWADYSTLEFLSGFVERANSAGVLMLLTARPGFIPPWTSTQADTATLSPLGQQDVEQMVMALDARLPKETVARIIERADGVPLFIEEIVASIADAANATIPSTLHDLLATRVDDLGRAKGTAQLAACLGREFDLPLLQAASTLDGQQVDEHLTLLFETGLLTERGQTTAQFKHALIQDVCYQSQTRADRKAAHQRIAQALLTDFPELVATRPELAARHCFGGGEIARAAEYWAMAGRRDLATGANIEAIEHLNAALDALHSLPADGTYTRLETMLYLNLGAAWMSAGGYGCEEARQAHLKAMELSGGEKDEAGLFATLRRLWMVDYMYLGSQAASEMAEQMLRLAQQTKDPVQLQAAHDSYGVSIACSGDLAGGFAHHTQGAALYRPEHHSEMVARFGENVAINNGVHLAMILWLRGYPGQSWACVESALANAREQAHPHSLCIALYGCALVSRWRRDVEVSARYVEESLACAAEFELPFWQLSAAADWAWVSAMRGDASDSLAFLDQLRDNPEIPGAARILFYQQLADGLVHLARYPEALAVLDDAIALADERNEPYLEADYHRLKGICLMEASPDDVQEAETCFNKALSISRHQGALSLELRAATDMATLWRETGREREATRLLDDVHGRLEEDVVRERLI
ncbi:adenylate/guanylate cyclase family protein,putative transcriptional regulator [Thiorhodovibrio frisius]|uniref:Adenylate/guanylate cyclase family protein,putative transcriptional regulator n=2 Tax=Thiorhodovibrio frisius TaxID=631362 RepID=H8YY65_9GAMM|nr:adenylate/guanylate cyclase family protein,putative transcriptional regulator [Thiorhodovibrio frisius]WPL23526.1 Adenylate cyclase 1 [Thiorhodovibrio frisius]